MASANRSGHCPRPQNWGNLLTSWPPECCWLMRGGGKAHRFPPAFFTLIFRLLQNFGGKAGSPAYFARIPFLALFSFLFFGLLERSPPG